MKDILINNAQRLKYLVVALHENSESINDKEEYLDLLYRSESITRKQYEYYKKNFSDKNIRKQVIGFGIAALTAIVVGKLIYGENAIV